MSKYSIVHRKYVLNASKAEINKKEIQKVVQQKNDSKISDTDSSRKSTSPLKLNANKLNNFYANKIFGKRASEIHEIIKKERSKSNSLSSNGSTCKVSKCKLKPKSTNFDSTNECDRTVDDPTDYIHYVLDSDNQKDKQVEEFDDFADNQIDCMINDFEDDSKANNPFQKAKDTALKQKNKIQNEIYEIMDTEEFVKRNQQSNKRIKLEGGELCKQTRFVCDGAPSTRIVKAKVHNLTKATRKCSAKRGCKVEKGKVIMKNGQTNLSSFCKVSK